MTYDELSTVMRLWDDNDGELDGNDVAGIGSAKNKESKNRRDKEPTIKRATLTE